VDSLNLKPDRAIKAEYDKVTLWRILWIDVKFWRAFL